MNYRSIDTTVVPWELKWIKKELSQQPSLNDCVPSVLSEVEDLHPHTDKDTHSSKRTAKPRPLVPLCGWMLSRSQGVCNYQTFRGSCKHEGSTQDVTGMTGLMWMGLHFSSGCSVKNESLPSWLLPLLVTL